jgi:ABC-type transport system involved in cytochrome c biogenesis permease subunit
MITLVAASVLEKLYGTAFVAEHVYRTAPFVALWFVAAASAAVYLLGRKILKRLPVALLHFSFLLILAGAFVTWLYGEQGRLHILQNGETNHFVDNRGNTRNLPFAIKLNDFHIEYYAGTDAPKDFVSSVTVSGDGKNGVTEGEISMNSIFSHRGYRFYQSGYDADEKGVTLAVAYDPYGIAVTYSGYALLLVSIVAFFFSRRSRFRELLKSPLMRAASVFILLLCGNTDMQSANPKALPRETAARFGDLYVLYNDRICPLQTLAKDFTVKLYGSPTYKGLTSEQVLTGWIFYYSDWKEQPIVKIKSKTVGTALGIEGKYASLDDFYDKYNDYKLEETMRKIHAGEQTADRKGFEEADEKRNLLAILSSGRPLKIYPHADMKSIGWYSQGEDLPDDMPGDEWFFVRKSLDYINEMAVKKDFEGLSGLLVKLKEYQRKKAGVILPDDSRMKAEKIYNGFIYTRFIAMFCLLAGILSFFYFCNRMINGKKINGRIESALCLAIAFVFVYLAASIALRWYVGGHVPLSNGFETMQFMSFSVILLTFPFRGRFFMSLPFGFLLCGLTLLVAMMGESNPRITHLIPVLTSPLLSIHVAVIMIAYSLFAFMMLNGLTGVIMYLMKKDSDRQIKQLYVISRVMLYPAVFCLAVGIFVGAVWANISWGRYWGWDPKEVWALITFLAYSLAFHGDSLPSFRRPMFFHVFSIAVFLCVLITYFGVNFILGGMHSYA